MDAGRGLIPRGWERWGTVTRALPRRGPAFWDGRLGTSLWGLGHLSYEAGMILNVFVKD